MSRRNQDKGRLPPFVALLKETIASPAWRAMSHGARSLYVCLKSRYNSNLHNNGRLYVSQRIAAREIGSSTNEIARWFRELQHYGFIVQTKGGSLGLNGKGTAPHWRLTECGYVKEPPTRDFARWEGEQFRDAPRSRRPKTESRHGKPLHPVTENRYISASRDSMTLKGTSVTGFHDMYKDEVSRDSVTYLDIPLRTRSLRAAENDEEA